MNLKQKQITIYNMAMSHLMDIGIRNALELTDEDIEQVEGNGLMSKEFVQELMKITREIAAWTFDERILYIQKNFQINGNMNSEQKIERLQTVVWNLLAYAQDANMWDISRPKMISEIIENGYMSKDDLELLDDEYIIEEYEEYMEGE